MRSWSRAYSEQDATLSAVVERVRAEDAERLRAEEAAHRRSDQLLRFGAALLKLATTPQPDLDAALRQITEVSAHTLGVERAAVWLFDDARAELRCRSFYLLSGRTNGQEATLRAEDFPRFFAELAKRPMIAAADVLEDERTQELAATHLVPGGVRSLLVVPIRLRGEVVGFLEHSHTRGVRAWSQEEQDFANSVVGTVALALEAEEGRRAAEALRESRERLDLAIASSRVGLWTWDLQTGGVWFSDEWKRQIGYEPQEIPDQFDEWVSRVHPEDMARSAGSGRLSLEPAPGVRNGVPHAASRRLVALDFRPCAAGVRRRGRALANARLPLRFHRSAPARRAASRADRPPREHPRTGAHGARARAAR